MSGELWWGAIASSLPWLEAALPWALRSCTGIAPSQETESGTSVGQQHCAHPKQDLLSNSYKVFHFMPFILCLPQYFFCFFPLIRWGVAVRGRACDVDGASGAKEKTDFHHEEQTLEDGEEALGAQVPVTPGTHTPGVFAECQMHFASPRNCIFAAATVTPQSQKKRPAEPGLPVWVYMITVKLWNLIFRVCNQRMDKVQICSTDTHSQVILPLYLKPNDSLLSGYLLKQTLCPGLLIPAHRQTEIRVAKCHVTSRFLRQCYLEKILYYLQRFMEQR